MDGLLAVFSFESKLQGLFSRQLPDFTVVSLVPQSGSGGEHERGGDDNGNERQTKEQERMSRELGPIKSA